MLIAVPRKPRCSSIANSIGAGMRGGWNWVGCVGVTGGCRVFVELTERVGCVRGRLPPERLLFLVAMLTPSRWLWLGARRDCNPGGRRLRVEGFSRRLFLRFVAAVRSYVASHSGLLRRLIECIRLILDVYIRFCKIAVDQH